MIEGRKLFLLVFILFSVFVWNKNAFSQEKLTFDTVIEEARTFKKTGKVFFNFEKIDLNLLTYFIAELTGKNIVIGTDLRGTASLVFSEPVTIKQAWDIYTSILRTRNYTVVDKGTHVEIVSTAISRNIVPPVQVRNGKSDEVVMCRLSSKEEHVVDEVCLSLCMLCLFLLASILYYSFASTCPSDSSGSLHLHAILCVMGTVRFIANF